MLPTSYSAAMTRWTIHISHGYSQVASTYCIRYLQGEKSQPRSPRVSRYESERIPAPLPKYLVQLGERQKEKESFTCHRILGTRPSQFPLFLDPSSMAGGWLAVMPAAALNNPYL